MKKKNKNGYYYVRTNSKGEKIFRRDTGESLEEVTSYLDSVEDVKYEVKEKGAMIWITRDKKYSYCYTTGRWAPYVKGGYPKKHYRSKGIKDFIERFTEPYVDEHLGCFSYPECEDFPTGCHIYAAKMGIPVEEFGHKD